MDAKRLAEALKSLDNQNFGPNDSTILSTINHPVNAGGKFLDWLKNQVNTAAGIPDQYDNPNPLLAPSPDAQSQAAFDLAGMAQVGSMPFAPKSAGGTVGTFIGPKAATWDADKAAAAAKMLDEGSDPAQVWREHLIGRMPDGALFSEIDDSLSFMKPSSEWGWGNREGFKQGERAIGSLDEFMSHQGIADNYPGFFDFGDDGRRMVMTIDKNAGEGGSFGDSSIRLGAMDNADGSSIANKSTALHELQHAIQQREGWARGGSPEQFSNGRVKDVLKESLSAIEKEQAVLRSLYSIADDATKQQIINKNKELNARKTDLQRMDEGRLMVDSYRRLTGEAQARATQDRLNMNMDERRANYPLAGGKLSDIPLEQLIYRYGDNGPAMAMDDNLNAGLLAKYLREGQLSPQELAQYETNAVQMTDSGKHHFNLANANAQGGTPESRAVDLGFDTPAFHGTKGDLSSINPSEDGFMGKGIYLSNDANESAFFATRKGIDGTNIIPAKIKGNLTEWDGDDYRHQKLQNLDIVNNGYDGTYKDFNKVNTEYNIFDPKNIRSRFAAFDPLRKDSANLLATRLLPATMLGYGMANQKPDNQSIAEALRGQ